MVEMIEQVNDSFTTGGTRIADYVKPATDAKPTPPSPGMDTTDDGGEPAVIDPRGIALRNPDEVRALIDHVMTLPSDQRKTHAYWNPSHPNHNAAVAEMLHLRELLEQPVETKRSPDEVTQEEMGIEDLRRYTGVNVPEGLMSKARPGLREAYEAGPYEGQFLRWVADEGIPANIAQRVADFYVERIVLDAGKLTDEDFEDFRDTFKGKLNDAQIAELERYAKEELKVIG